MKKDYNKMRCVLSAYEAEQLTTEDIYYILLDGTLSYKDISNKEIERMFITIFDEKDIPFIKELKWKNVTNVKKLKI